MQATGISDIDVPALDLDRPAAEQIFVSLRQAILNMDLAPGRALSETEIGQHFGASRTPVRSALAQLRDAGLIVTRPSRGNYVAKLSEHRIRAAQLIRECIEVGVVRRLCEEGLEDAHRARLDAALTGQKQAIDAAEGVDFYLADEAFHNGLALATGFEQVHAVYVREKGDLLRLRHLGMHDMAHKTRLLADHRAILDAILRRDAAAAEAAMQTHVRDVLTKLSGLIAANRDYFE